MDPVDLNLGRNMYSGNILDDVLDNILVDILINTDWYVRGI